MRDPGQKTFGVLCILRHEDTFLLLRRSKPDALHDKYVPIGGHVEPYEAPRDAVIREVREETGILLSDVTFRGTLVETSPVSYNWITFIYSADVAACDPPACDEGTLEWVPVSRLADIPTPSTDLVIYRLVSEGRVFALDARYDREIRLLTMVDEATGTVFVP